MTLSPSLLSTLIRKNILFISLRFCSGKKTFPPFCPKARLESYAKISDNSTRAEISGAEISFSHLETACEVMLGLTATSSCVRHAFLRNLWKSLTECFLHNYFLLLYEYKPRQSCSRPTHTHVYAYIILHSVIN